MPSDSYRRRSKSIAVSLVIRVMSVECCYLPFFVDFVLSMKLLKSSTSECNEAYFSGCSIHVGWIGMDPRAVLSTTTLLRTRGIGSGGSWGEGGAD